MTYRTRLRRPVMICTIGLRPRTLLGLDEAMAAVGRRYGHAAADDAGPSSLDHRSANSVAIAASMAFRRRRMSAPASMPR